MVTSQDELRALQLERLRWSLAHAHDNVQHYQRRFQDHGVRPEGLKSLEDLAKFPFTTKGDLRDNYPFGMFAVPREAMRAEIERRMGLVALDIYGLSEVMGPGVASECVESRDGPVIWEDHFYSEIIDPDTGRVLPDGPTASWC